AVRIFLAENLRHAPLVRGIGVGMDQADTDGAHASAAEEPRGGADVGLVERTQLLPAEIETAADLAHEVEGHQTLRLHPEIGVAVALGHGLPRDLHDMAEAGR